jgi:hypothetical protein
MDLTRGPQPVDLIGPWMDIRPGLGLAPGDFRGPYLTGLPVGERVRAGTHRDPLGRLGGRQRVRERHIQRYRQRTRLLGGPPLGLRPPQCRLRLAGGGEPGVVTGGERLVCGAPLLDLLAHPAAQTHGGYLPRLSRQIVG